MKLAEGFKAVMVRAKFDPDHNAVRENVIRRTDNMKEAESWLNMESGPAMIFIDGMQNHDRFLDMFCVFNKKYWEEYKKVKD